MKKLLITIILSIAIGLAAVFMCKFKMGDIISFAITPQKELYVLYSDADEEGNYAGLLKTDSKGNIIFQQNLPYYEGNSCYLYQEMELDSKGNVYIRMEEYDTTTMSENRPSWTIIGEQINVYDFEGTPKGTVLNFKNDLKTENAIIKLQMLNDELLVYCKNDEQYYITKLKESDAGKNRYFTVDHSPDVKKDAIYISDIAVNKKNEIVYSTNSGQLYIQSGKDSWKRISDYFGNNCVIREFSLDANNNIYFTEQSTGGFYRYNYTDKTISKLYSSEDTIAKNILFSDVKKSSIVSDNFYSSCSINAEHWFFAGYGEDSMIISTIHLPLKDTVLIFAKWTGGSLLILGLGLVLLNSLRSRLSLKIIFAFLPVYIISTVIFGYIIVNDNMNTYRENLYQLLQAGARVAAQHIPIDTLESYNFSSDYMGKDFALLKKSLENGMRDIDKNLYDANGYMVVYKVDGDRVYSIVTTDLSELTDKQAGSQPVEYITNKKTVQQIYNLLKETKNTEVSPEDVLHLSNRDYTGTWMGVITPLTNEQGKVVGLVENGVNKAITYDVVLQNTVKKLGITISIITIFVFLFFLFVIGKCLNPLKGLEKTMKEISQGRWGSKVKVTTGDEIGDIGNTFNLMTANILEHITNFMDLNRAYVKFIPNELIKLLDKKDILEVNLFDSSVKEMSMLFVNFNLVSNRALNMTATDYFNLMNKHFDVLFELAAANGGIIERFDGMGMLILFEDGSEAALKTSLQFQEILEDSSVIKKTLRMIISSGETLIGVAGNKERNSITTVSTEVMQIYALNNYLNRLDMQYIITEDAVSGIGMKNTICRFVGKLPHISQKNPIGIYEVIGSSGLYVDTKECFETGVKAYLDGNFTDARKNFVDVLRVNEKDKMAMHYLSLCEYNQSNLPQDWNGTFLD